MGILRGFAEFTPAERLFAEFVPSLLEQGLSANSIIRQAQSVGLSIRRTRGLSIIRYAKGVVDSRSYLSSVGLNRNWSLDRMPYSKLPLQRLFRYQVKLSVRDVTTGAVIDRHVWMQTDDYYTKARAVNEAAAIYAQRTQSMKWEFVGGKLTGVERNIAAIGKV